MLFVHETHQVAGREADRFEELYRDGWSAALAAGTDARLLWFMDQAHGTGPAYTFVTVTAVASAAALDDLNARRRGGDLKKWTAEVDALRHGSLAKVLEPAPFSPLTDIDLGSVAAIGSPAAEDGGLPLFMEDTAWPFRGSFDDYLEKAGSLYMTTLERSAKAGHGKGLLEMVAAFIPRFGSGKHREVILWQRVGRPDMLLPLLNHEVPMEYRSAGTWMHDALDVRDQWESRLLKVASWSPMG
jgi:hypothetical protein